MMMLDEEAVANERGRMLPSDVPPPGPEPQEGIDPEIAAERAAREPPQEAAAESRPATPREEKMFNTLLKQSLLFLTSKQSTDFIAASSEAKGPEQALADSVSAVVGNAVEAAGAGGILIPDPVKGAATQVALRTLALLMVKGGVADDPQALISGATALMEQPQAPQQPQPQEAPNVAAG